jgi:hypothetical protein
MAAGNQQAAVAFYDASPWWYGAKRIVQRLVPHLLHVGGA